MNKYNFKSAYDKITLSHEFKEQAKKRLTETDCTAIEDDSGEHEMKSFTLNSEKKSSKKWAFGACAAAVLVIGVSAAGIMSRSHPSPLGTPTAEVTYEATSEAVPPLDTAEIIVIQQTEEAAATEEAVITEEADSTEEAQPPKDSVPDYLDGIIYYAEMSSGSVEQYKERLINTAPEAQIDGIYISSQEIELFRDEDGKFYVEDTSAQITSGAVETGMFFNIIYENRMSYVSGVIFRDENLGFAAHHLDLTPDERYFGLDLMLPKEWSLPEGGISAEGQIIADENGEAIGLISCNSYEIYPEAVGQPNYYRMVYGKLMMGSIVSWDCNYTPVMKTEYSENAVCTIMSYNINTNETEYHCGVLAYNDILQYYVNISFGTEIDYITQKRIAQSILLSADGSAEEIAQPPVYAYDPDGNCYMLYETENEDVILPYDTGFLRVAMKFGQTITQAYMTDENGEKHHLEVFEEDKVLLEKLATDSVLTIHLKEGYDGAEAVCRIMVEADPAQGENALPKPPALTIEANGITYPVLTAIYDWYYNGEMLYKTSDVEGAPTIPDTQWIDEIKINIPDVEGAEIVSVTCFDDSFTKGTMIVYDDGRLVLPSQARVSDDYTITMRYPQGTVKYRFRTEDVRTKPYNCYLTSEAQNTRIYMADYSWTYDYNGKPVTVAEYDCGYEMSALELGKTPQADELYSIDISNPVYITTIGRSIPRKVTCYAEDGTTQNVEIDPLTKLILFPKEPIGTAYSVYVECIDDNNKEIGWCNYYFYAK